MKAYPLLVFALILFGCNSDPDPSKINAKTPFSAVEVLTAQNDLFEKATTARPFVFPEDHFSHPHFKTEWWYWTGHLKDSEGEPYSYQLTFFRTSNDRPLKKSPWNASETWMAHFTVGAPQKKKFVFFERFERGANLDSKEAALHALAGSDAFNNTIFIHGWSAKLLATAPLAFELSARGNKTTRLNLKLIAEKPITLQGDQGLSWKNKERTNASYYYSSTRMKTEGVLTLEGKEIPVTGQSWLDREWSSGSLSKTQSGWDWFSLQMNDGTDVMLFQIREKSSEANFRSGKLVLANGESRSLDPTQMELQPQSEWVSPTNARYPASWSVRWESGKRYIIRPVFADQELRLKFRYWEGAVQVETPAGEVMGQGFLEMTGY
ncbi:MAG: hypothetical protein K2X47_13080 [Bdellovibrionales bacterium]|nr:hypothetical protein [Bdellovibrionales bacterium]